MKDVFSSNPGFQYADHMMRTEGGWMQKVQANGKRKKEVVTMGENYIADEKTEVYSVTVRGPGGDQPYDFFAAGNRVFRQGPIGRPHQVASHGDVGRVVEEFCTQSKHLR
jgi:hypothetical protein